MKPLPRIEGEVQRYQLGPDGDEWVKADDYAALNDYAALVQMERDSARAEVERLRAALASIAANTCCDSCREAALVAQAAIRNTYHVPGSPE